MRRRSGVRATFSRYDRRLLAAATRRRHPVSDRVATVASTVANRSLVWTAAAGVLVVTGRRRARTAAASGMLGIGIAAGLVNGPLKFAWRRDRPPELAGAKPLLPLPRTFSFPSGHSASAFAFAAGVTSALPPAGVAALPAATTVAYSRVHTGVHYPSDVVVGAAVGAASGLVAAAVVKRVRARSVHRVDAPELEVPVPTQAVLLVSPGAGAADDLDPAKAALREAGISIVREYGVDEIAELERYVDDAGDVAPLVIAAGGDGTVGLAAGVVADTPAVLFPLPLGTSNDVARSLGIPPDAVEAAQELMSYRVVAVDAGRVGIDGGRQGVTFLNATTVGLNVAFAELATEKSMRNRFGALTYPVAAARAVRRYVPFECTIERDGESRTFSLVHLSVSNAPVFGGVLGIRVPGASLTDGLLDVIAIERLSIARTVLAVADAFVGRHSPVHGVHAMRVTSLRVTGDEPHDVAVDGEVIGALPAEFAVRPAAVRVVAPRPVRR
ncbi:bifunctional phosphatase PAP2/diacylglycerol kinase family protein [Jatrophihabitans fulvus]